jgi:hypothetical protein
MVDGKTITVDNAFLSSFILAPNLSLTGSPEGPGKPVSP